jgi:hypothetical protein
MQTLGEVVAVLEDLLEKLFARPFKTRYLAHVSLSVCD